MMKKRLAHKSYFNILIVVRLYTTVDEKGKN